MGKLRVALVIPTHSDLHSSLANLLKVYRRLIKSKGIEVTIFTDKRNKAKYDGFRIERIEGIDYNTIFSKALFVLGIPRFWYRDLIEKLKGYDMIESSNPEFYGFAYQSFKAAKKYNSRLIYRTSQTVDGFYLFRLSKYFVVPMARKAYDYASSLLFTNPEALERAVRLGLADKSSKKLVIIGHATDTDTFRPLKIKKPGRKKILLSVGGLYKIKGHHLIIKALKKIIDKGHDAELWVVGEGYYKKSLQRLSKSIGIGDKVKFLGSKGHAELAKIYNMADAFVLANYQEITPAVNEAMACGIPVVVMDCGGREFVVPSSDYGLVSGRFDSDDMAEKIGFLLENRGAAERMASSGRKRVLENFSVEKVASKIYDSMRQ